MLTALRRYTRPFRRAVVRTVTGGRAAPQQPDQGELVISGRHSQHAKLTFSACGEDAIAMNYLWLLGVGSKEVRYLDVGAAQPVHISNTYAFYRHGARGVLVEPDPAQAAVLRAERPRDVVVNAGAAIDERRELTLTRFTAPVFNTFDEQQAARVVEQSKTWLPEQRQNVVDRITVPMISINTIVEEHCAGAAPHFLSIDAEGCDARILASLDLGRFRPLVICIERSGPPPDFASLPPGYRYEQVALLPDNAIYVLRH